MHHQAELATILAVLGVASAMPTTPNVISARQSDKDLKTCKDNKCGDCNMFFSAGTGWPDCPYYTGEQLTDNGFPETENGQIQIFIDVPPQDNPDCKVLIRTPVRPNDQNCGGNVIVAEGETCAPITVDNTFIASFCCGIDDCNAAGAPGKRSLQSSPLQGRATGDVLTLHDMDGNVIEPHTAAVLQNRSAAASNLQSRGEGAAVVKQLTKRDCKDFKVSKGPYTTGGENHIISDTVTCTSTSECEATIGKEVTEETSYSASVSVGDPLGIVSATVGFEFSESVTQSFEGTWKFGPGERGYVVFIPILTCVEGTFTGDCDDDGVQTTICGADGAGGEMKGERRGVLIRG